MEAKMSHPVLMNFSSFIDENGILCVYEGEKDIPFAVRRIFTVSAKEGDVRGMHAHKRCKQLLVCSFGKIRVVCDVGLEKYEFELSAPSGGLLIPEGVWSSQEYLVDNSVLMVFCDHSYQESDYIRDFEEFKKHIGL